MIGWDADAQGANRGTSAHAFRLERHENDPCYSQEVIKINGGLVQNKKHRAGIPGCDRPSENGWAGWGPGHAGWRPMKAV